ncbi:MAG: SprT family zinc-dependent metalloprotease [Candidatus Omnitrophota bacterium]|nr:SprT family zinc-dependent metalloprotease [Candidatus Omnitrophota bacterium]
MTEIRIDKLLRSRRRTIELEVSQDAKLVVRAPLHVPVEDIQNILLKKRDWIIEKQAFLRKRKDQYIPKKFINGESFYYLGKPYRLNLINEGTIRLTDYLEFPSALLSDAHHQLTQWYKAVAYENIKERAELYSKIIGLSYERVKISDAKKRFGSCSVRGNLNFSWRIIMSPLYVIDYVVVHELIHLEEHNHSQRFWQKVKRIFPGYQQAKEWLKENDHLLKI